MEVSSSSEQRLADTLGTDLQVKWTGEPKQGFLLRRRDALLIPFSALWCGFAIFWESSVFAVNAPLLFRLWGIPFVCAGVYIFVGRFIVDSYFRAHTVYGITEDAVYIVRDGLLPRIVRYDARSISPVEMQQNRNGYGTLTFNAQPLGFYGWGIWQVGVGNAFEGVPDVVNVLRLVERLV